MKKKIQGLVTSLAKGAEATRCVFNGVIGDTLEENEIGLAMKMGLSAVDRLLTITKKSLSRMNLPDTGKICILAHGSCSSEKGWSFKGDASTNYGSLLQKDFGFTPFFLRYNSGLHISTNGKRLSRLLEKLVLCYPKKIREVMLIGHSMGGLVFRSACYYGQKEKRKWVRICVTDT